VSQKRGDNHDLHGVAADGSRFSGVSCRVIERIVQGVGGRISISYRMVRIISHQINK